MSKIAFLFLAVGSIHHEPCWENFFRGHEQECSIYVHSKRGGEPGSFFKPFELQKTVPTTWHNTMRAQVELLRVALQDPDNTKFVFSSETTVPLKPLPYIKKYLFRHPHSEFKYTNNRHHDRKFGAISWSKVKKNSQWVVLNRKHAQMIADDTKILYEMTQDRNMDNEHYPSTFLAMRGQAKEIVQRDTTFVLWPKDRPNSAHPHTFYNLREDKHAPKLISALKAPHKLFARKIDKDCDISLITNHLKKSGLDAPGILCHVLSHFSYRLLCLDRFPTDGQDR